LQQLNFLEKYWTAFLDVFYPENCQACAMQLVGNEQVICTKCQVSLPRTNSHLVEIPSLVLKFAGKVPVQSAFSFLKFEKGGKVQHLLHALKYKNKPEVGTLLGKMYGQELRQSNLHFDLVVGVPLHARKQAQRGYNQADALAQGLAEGLGISWSDKVAIRQKFTETQTGKSRAERHENVAKIFKITQPQLIQNKHVVVIDDVITTGATIESLLIELLNNGAKSVSVVTLAAAI
jgi:ComF family protein